MKFDSILFDCDGVLVDSEPIVNAVPARCWPPFRHTGAGLPI